MNFSALTVRTRLTTAFGAVTALLLLIAGLAWHALSVESESFEHFVNGVNARLRTANAVRLAVDERAIAARNLVLVTRPEDLAMERAHVEQAHAAASQQLAKLKEMAQAPGVSEQGKVLIAKIADVESRYAPVALEIVRLALDQKREEAIQRTLRSAGEV